VVTGVIPVRVRQAAVVGIAAVQAIAAVLKNCLFPSFFAKNRIKKSKRLLVGLYRIFQIIRKKPLYPAVSALGGTRARNRQAVLYKMLGDNDF
jgi:hypothetical protein